jgi:hypothetical protein
MKLTKEYLKRIIKEELDATEQEAPADPAQPNAADLDSSAGGKEQADVSKVLSYIGKIDNRKELAQVLMAVVQHSSNVAGSAAVLKKLYKNLPSIIKGGQ